MVESESVLAKEEVVEVAVVVVRTEGALIAQEVGEDSIVFAVIDRGRLARWRAPL